MILIIALLDVALLSVGHAYGNRALIGLSIAAFMALVILSEKSYFLPLMIFYLPWSSVLRLDPGESSFHTLVLPVFFFFILFKWLKKNPDIRKSYFLLAFILLSFTLVVKLFNGLPLHKPYLFFMIMLFFVPIYLSEYVQNIRFDQCVVFLTAGNISACIASNLLMNNPNILKFIDINDEMRVGLRLSSFYGDPNYFSAQILVALAGLLIILFKTKDKRTVLALVLSMAALIYFALLAVSKMFILCLIIILVLWTYNLLIEKRSLSYKVGILSTLVIISVVIILENLFMEQINYYIYRFGYVSDPISLTTGRIVLWQVYMEYLFSYIDKLIFGIGLSEDQLRILLNTNNAHMTLIEIIYQLGLAGGTLLFLWWKSVYNEFVTKTQINYSGWVNLLVMATAVFLPWLALDMLYFREFFYFILLLFLLKNYLSDRNVSDETRGGSKIP